MRALTVCQPWAWAIVDGRKSVENRTWRTDYRGPLAIHAGLSRAHLDAMESYPDLSRWDDDDLVFGAIIGVVELVDCVRVAPPWPIERFPAAEQPELRRTWPRGEVPDPWATGPWCWLLERPRAITPIPCRGALGLWMPPLKLLEAV